MYSVAIEWKDRCPNGQVAVRNGKLHSITVAKGDGEAIGDKFSKAQRLILNIDDVNVDHGDEATVVTVNSDALPFSFILRDVNTDYPIFIPEYSVVVTDVSDSRSYDEIQNAIIALGGKTKLEIIETEDEECYDNAAEHTRDQVCPTWLGLSRDVRFFEFDERLHTWGQNGPAVRPRYPNGYLTEKHQHPQSPCAGQQLHYNFRMGKGIGCVEDKSRHLEDGVLPIVVGKQVDDEVDYNYTLFTSLERSSLASNTVQGTHYLVASASMYGFNLTPEYEKAIEEMLPSEFYDREETVLYCRVVATNNAIVPRYAWLRAPIPFDQSNDTFYNTGLGSFEEGKFFCTAKLNGKPWPKDEVTILIKPGETATMDFALPYNPLPKDRAKQLLAQDFDTRHSECREYWLNKLRAAATMRVPEQRISEMILAGLIHLDMITFGREPDGTLSPTIGVYCPIGTESAPIIQFMDSMGLHDIARRCLDFFFETQHEDGFIQSFCHYELETQAVLWCAGEHYRYTRDDDWVRRIEPNILKACEYLRAWRARNMRDELRSIGYGLLEGSVADPVEPFRHFTANGYYYVGLSRAAEMLKNVNPEQAKAIRAEADAVKTDVRTACLDAMAKSPVVPLGDGTWSPTIPAWAESTFPTFLALDKNTAYTHGTFVARDAMIGPMYLVFCEVFDYIEPIADTMIKYFTDILHTRNVALSQPYYCRQPELHLKRGETKAFLKAYYNCFSGLADRETYSFYEHFYHVSPHKTHEEGWFLMETRWMLYMEDGDTLKLLQGAPRKWLESGKEIEIKNAASYFGPISMKIKSQLDQSKIHVKIECNTDRKPKCVQIRLPHPDGCKAVRVSTGKYDPISESVIIDSFTGSIDLVLEF
ncbi:MAG: hypothetical protein ABFD54_03190 [Armatimonadota bacterium]|nr:hypothetical protein [bacterium]